MSDRGVVYSIWKSGRGSNYWSDVHARHIGTLFLRRVMSERGWCAKTAAILGRAQVGGWAHGEYPKGYGRNLGFFQSWATAKGYGRNLVSLIFDRKYQHVCHTKSKYYGMIVVIDMG